MDLPKPELQTFDGKAKDYNMFIHSFEGSIGESSLSDRAKLNYLVQFCKGEPQEFIQPFTLLEPSVGYVKAKEMLRGQYGKPHIVAREVVRDVIEGRDLRLGDSKALGDLYKNMVKCQITLQSNGSNAILHSTDTLRKIVRRLPNALRVKWVDKACTIEELTGEEATFDHLLSFIKKCSDSANTLYGMDLSLSKRDSTGNSKSSFSKSNSGGSSLVAQADSEKGQNGDLRKQVTSVDVVKGSA